MSKGLLYSHIIWHRFVLKAFFTIVSTRCTQAFVLSFLGKQESRHTERNLDSNFFARGRIRPSVDVGMTENTIIHRTLSRRYLARSTNAKFYYGVINKLFRCLLRGFPL